MDSKQNLSVPILVPTPSNFIVDFFSRVIKHFKCRNLVLMAAPLFTQQ